MSRVRRPKGCPDKVKPLLRELITSGTVLVVTSGHFVSVMETAQILSDFKEFCTVSACFPHGFQYVPHVLSAYVEFEPGFKGEHESNGQEWFQLSSIIFETVAIWSVCGTNHLTTLQKAHLQISGKHLHCQATSSSPVPSF